MRAPIVNIGELRAETADIDRKFGQQTLPAKLVKHRENFLCFAQCEHWYQHARVALKRGPERLAEASLLTGAGPALRFCVVAPGAFHDQHIKFFLWESRRFHNGLIVEIDVTSVKNGSPFGAQHYSSRAEYVACVEELKCQGMFFATGRPFASNGHWLAQRTPTPALR